jgi:hypothetical protein
VNPGQWRNSGNQRRVVAFFICRLKARPEARFFAIRVFKKQKPAVFFSRAEPFVGTQIKIAASAGIADRKILGAEIERQFHKHFLSN